MCWMRVEDVFVSVLSFVRRSMRVCVCVCVCACLCLCLWKEEEGEFRNTQKQQQQKNNDSEMGLKPGKFLRQLKD